MNRHFIKHPVLASTFKYQTHLKRLKVGVLDEGICIMFKFSKRKFYKEECLSYSGEYWIGDCPASFPSMDELAEEVITLGYGTGDIAGLCISGTGYPLECDFDELTDDESQLPEDLVEYYGWLVSNQSRLFEAINRYAADPNNYQEFDDEW